ncbi:hypothetical protein FE257_010405 [Aspergillus nanangensis]|uniref:Uncharacterized protein n=1 Tax=Aspergillus nanangensis TaxID=2582783 RepID=A0AAD4GS52_ASPNN|nr:hypothetical protein FE257_010405 [Aspergillus nanangensis]
MHATTILSLALALVPFCSADPNARVMLFNQPNFQGQNMEVPMHECVGVKHMERVGSMNIQPFEGALCTLYSDMGCHNGPLCTTTRSVSDFRRGDEDCRPEVGDRMQTILCRTVNQQ